MKISFCMVPVLVFVLGFTSCSQGILGNEEQVTLSGELQTREGIPSIESNAQIYYIPAITQYKDSIDGLDDGVNVTVRGKSYKDGTRLCVDPETISTGNRTYSCGNGRCW
jgi:hypothetical protein